MIQSAGLEPGQLSFIPDLSTDLVIRQLHNNKDIAEGDSLQKGSYIDLVLGKGLSNQRTAVPDLMGLKLPAAKNTILGASLNLAAYIYDSSIASAEDSIKAFVFKQNPEFKETSSVQLGSGMYIWLTTDSTKLPVDSTLVVKTDSLKTDSKGKKPSDKNR